MNVELDAFSGRPNPQWTLPFEDAKVIRAKIASLPKTEDRPNIPDLGFRGFILTSGDFSCRVHQGIILIRNGGTISSYSDTAGIQEELFAQARKQGFGSVLDGF